MRHGYSPMDACRLAVERIIAKHKDLTNLQAGFIAIDKNGVVGSYSVYNGFNYALKTETEEKMVDAPFNRNW
jgi:isoaspartyl peptidase/L-asparaginase-like protein (Ntn-hydrolase superfamily)